MQKLKKNDTVIIIAGKFKGKVGRITKVLNKGRHIIVEGVNLLTHFIKANPQAQEPGRIDKREGKIDASNAAIYNHNTKKADRVGFKFEEVDGQTVKRRYYKSNGEMIQDV